jgi:methionine synthase II (cobalamin-independent)
VDSYSGCPGEFARRGYDELSVFSDLDPKIGLGIGVIDIKDNEVESADEVASRIETILKTVGEQRLQYVHPTAASGCCGAVSWIGSYGRW